MSIEPIYLTLVPGGIGALQCRMTNLQGLCFYNVKCSVCFFAFRTPSPFSPFPLRGAIFKTKQALNHRHHKYLYIAIPLYNGLLTGILGSRSD